MSALSPKSSSSRTDSNCREAIAQLQAGQARLEAGQAQIAAQLETLISLVNANHRSATDIALLPNSTDASPSRDKRPRDHDTQPSVLGNPEDPWSYHKETIPADVPVRLLPQLVQLANSEDPKDQLQGTLLIRKLLCVSKNAPIEQVVASQIVPRLVSFLLRDDFVDLQLEAAWTVSKVASGGTTHISHVMEQGAVPHFIRILNSSSEAIREQATWALGNMAGDSATCRDYILGQGVMAPLLQCITTPAGDVSVLRNSVWAVSNLCRSKPSPDLDTVCQALPVIVPLLVHDDQEVVTHICWALALITNSSRPRRAARVERVLNTGVLPQIIALLSSVHASQELPALRVVGDMAAGSDEQTQLLISSGALSSFHPLLQHPRRRIRQEACWALSNITAGTREQIQAVIEEELFPAILQCIGAVAYEVKKEAILCVANLAASGTPEQVRYVVEELNVFGELVPALEVKSTEILNVTLGCIRNLLEAGEKEKDRRGLAKNPYAQVFIGEGAVPHLQKLQSHGNNDVRTMAVTIVNTFST